MKKYYNKKGLYLMKLERQFFLRKRLLLLEDENKIIQIGYLLSKKYKETNSEINERYETLLTCSREIDLLSMTTLEQKYYLDTASIEEREISLKQLKQIYKKYDEEKFVVMLDYDLDSFIKRLENQSSPQ